MQSKTSFFNGTLLRKNLTRFAPVWGLYTLCLVVGLFMEYTNTDIARFWFAYHLGRTIDVMALVNAGYALLIAQLLFGDLYSSRMCNMLHALPLRREGWFVTSLCSALVMSLVPTAIMTIFSWVLLANTIFQNAWVISLGLFLASNLQFILFFGLAAFAAMATANRFAMAAGYGLLNFGAEIVYFLVDTVYTPMLYGVVTPRALVNNLTPLNSLQGEYFTTTAFEEVIDETRKLLPGAIATFQFAETWLTLFIWTAVGLVFLALALVLYRKRQLECAGDAVAFPVLKPVFNIFCALFVTAAAVFVPKMILGMQKGTFLFLALGLCLAVTLGATKLDILNIEEYRPETEDIQSVYLSVSAPGLDTESPEDFQKILRLQELILEDRLEDWGIFIIIPEHGTLSYGDAEELGYDLVNSDYDWTEVSNLNLSYTLKNGKIVTRNYNVWTEGEAGDIIRELCSRWEVVNNTTTYVKGKEVPALDLVLEDFRSMNFSGDKDVDKVVLTDVETAYGLIEAVKRDCAEGTMTQDSSFHVGVFRFPDEDAEMGYRDQRTLWVNLYSERNGWDVRVFPDSRHTIAFLKSLGMADCEIIPERQPLH